MEKEENKGVIDINNQEKNINKEILEHMKNIEKTLSEYVMIIMFVVIFSAVFYLGMISITIRNIDNNVDEISSNISSIDFD